MCLEQEATHADHAHVGYKHTHACKHVAMDTCNTFQRRWRRGKKRRQTVEREMDKRDEEITRADTKRAKGNKSFTQKAAEVEAAFSSARMLGSVGAGHIVGDALQQSALLKNDS